LTSASVRSRQGERLRAVSHAGPIAAVMDAVFGEPARPQDYIFLRAGVRGTFWYLYAIIDVWSRKLVGWAVHDVQSDDLAAALAAQTYAREGVTPQQLVLHADNGAAMKGKTMLVKLEELGIVPSFSRPRVSDDNPFIESAFRTLKYRPSYPSKPFLTIEDASAWVAGFVGWYNDDHYAGAVAMRSPRSTGASSFANLLRYCA
jgi:transposase InsO family protein